MRTDTLVTATEVAAGRKPMRRAVIYARQSEARKDKSEGSTVTQFNEATALIDRTEDLKLTEVYEDLDFSAFTGEERPAFERMLKDARAGLIDVIVVSYVSRLSRQEPKDALPVILELQRLGVQFISVYEGPVTDDLIGLVTLLMRLNSAYEESRNKSLAVSGTKRTLKAAGGFVGGVPPFGFSTETKRVDNLTIRVLVPEPDEVKVIQDVVDRILKYKDVPYVPGKPHPGSLTGVCAWLNETGVPTRGIESHAKRGIAAPSWKVTTLRRVLTDPRLMGHQTEPMYETVPKKDGKGTWKKRIGYRSVRDEKGRPVISHKPIVDPIRYHELQKCLAIAKETSAPKGTSLTRGDSLLSALGVLFCEGAHTMCKQAGKTAAMTTYTCQRKKGVTSTHEGTVAVLRDRLDKYVAERILKRLNALDYEDPDDIALLVEATQRFTAKHAAPDVAAEKHDVTIERADYKAALAELWDDFDAGVYKGTMGRDRFIKKRDDLEAAIQRCDERLTELEGKVPTLVSPKVWTETKEPGGDMTGEGSWWYSASMTDRRDFVTLFVDKIVVAKAPNFGTGYEPVPIEERVKITWAKPKEGSAK
ncbi:recombinase family protein [Streptomyces sp. TG1A-8]|uniref:recombinase family protein n=1 Tax=Streptomyces sp. TG1A-8 TaxID=3051385 RepID=UPI00265B97A6|nr:recombinase family protein [Streptomyces sp. TG1A-8]MDO0926771.1 recombinase family protein [Streptomyces sp. TG1A-8]